MAYVMYEREDREDRDSPYFLKEFNFLHTHSLNMAKSFPTTWDKMRREKENIIISDEEGRIT